MNELLEAAKRIVIENCGEKLEEDVLEFLAIAVMAHFIRNEKMSQERLPGILKDLKIYSSDKPLIDMVQEELGTVEDIEKLEKAGACVQRAISINEETHECFEERHMFVSTKGGLTTGAVDVINKAIHELTHLLKHGGITISGNEVKAVDGIATCRVNVDTGKRVRRNFHFEEGIVQRYTIQCMDMLHSLILNEDLPKDSLLYAFRKDYPDKFYDAFAIEVYTINQLCRNARFNELVEDSFYDTGSPSQVALYMNDVLGDSTAFTRFSRNMDKCREACDRLDSIEGQKVFDDIKKTIGTFHKKSIQKSIN